MQLVDHAPRFVGGGAVDAEADGRAGLQQRLDRGGAGTEALKVVGDVTQAIVAVVLSTYGTTRAVPAL